MEVRESVIVKPLCRRRRGRRRVVDGADAFPERDRTGQQFHGNGDAFGLCVAVLRERLVRCRASDDEGDDVATLRWLVHPDRKPQLQEEEGYGVIRIAEYGLFGTIGTMCAVLISFVCGSRSASITTLRNSGSLARPFRRLSRSSLDGNPRM
jgi:hypothetical protein